MTVSKLQTELDLTLIKQFILLPIVLDVLERDIKTLTTTTLKMTAVYVKNLEQVQRQAHDDLVRVRKQMKSHELKVYEENRNKIAIEAKYICRGYHHTFSMLWSLVKAEVQVYLAGYLNVDLDEEM